MRTLLCIGLLAAFALAAVADTDVTGIWKGSFNVAAAGGAEAQNGTAHLVLKQKGSEITGSVGPSEDQQFPIVKGKIEGNKITLEADHDGHTLTLNLVLAAEHITGDANVAQDGMNMKAKLDVTRQK
jgi:hypothetical protein